MKTNLTLALAAILTGTAFAAFPAPLPEFKNKKQLIEGRAEKRAKNEKSATQSAYFARPFLHGGLKSHSVNRLPGEETFRAAFAPVILHADVTGQIPHAAY